QGDMSAGEIRLQNAIGGMYGFDTALVNNQAAIVEHLADGHYGENPFGANDAVDCFWQSHKTAAQGVNEQRGVYRFIPRGSGSGVLAAVSRPFFVAVSLKARC